MRIALIVGSHRLAARAPDRASLSDMVDLAGYVSLRKCTWNSRRVHGNGIRSPSRGD